MSTTRSVPRPEQKRHDAADLIVIRALHDRYAAVFNSNDAKAVAAFYTQDAILMLTGIPAIQGRQAIQAMFENYFKQNAAKIGHTPLETQVAGDWAYERGKIKEDITPRSGQPLEQSFEYRANLKRQRDGAWKIHLGSDNSELKVPI